MCPHRVRPRRHEQALIATIKGELKANFGFLILPGLYACIALTLVFQRVVLEQLLVADDIVKALFAAVANPLAWELLIVYMRTIARILRYNHPSTSALFMLAPIAFKKMYGRFIIATMSSSVWVTVASVMLGFFEVRTSYRRWSSVS